MTPSVKADSAIFTEGTPTRDFERVRRIPARSRHRSANLYIDRFSIAA